MRHDDLVNIGYKWLMKRCAFAFKELRTKNIETPDIIGFIGNNSFLLEAKVSRADFLKDKKKPFRENPWLGMGDFRFFITPKNLVKIEELPSMWGLIEVDSGKTKVIHNPFGKGNIYSSWEGLEKNKNAEYAVLYSALRRKTIKE